MSDEAPETGMEQREDYCPRCDGVLEVVDSLHGMHMMKQCVDCEVVAETPHPAILNNTGQYELTPELLDELPDHPEGRLWPGYSNEGHDIVRTLVYEAPVEVFHGQLHGFIAAGRTTVHVHAEDEQLAAREAVESVSSGDLRPMAAGFGTQLEEPDPDLLAENYYSKDDEDWPVFEVDLIGAGRFYGYGDDADLSQTAPYCIATGDFGSCGFVNSWLARPVEVDVSRLAVEKAYVRQQLERLQERENDE